MSIRILINESNASRRAVPIWLVQSNGTSAATNESGRTFMFSIGNVFYGSGGSLSAVSALDGLYDCVFSASKVSVLGPGQVMYSSGTALPMSTPFEVVPIDSYDSMRYGLFALPNAAPGAANGLIAFGTGAGQLHVSSGSVGLKAQDHSGASVEVKTGGIQVASVGVGTYSGVTLGINNIAAGSYSGVTIQGVTRVLNLSANDDKTGYSISGTKTTLDALNDITGSGVTLHVGTHSGATVQGVTRLNSGVTLNADTHSGATIAGIVAGGIIAATLASGVITAAKFAASAIDAAALATDASQEIADAFLGRNIAGGSSTGRTVSEALYPLRNRSLIQGSVGTVYGTDDSTSAWTFAPSLGTAPLSGIDPQT